MTCKCGKCAGDLDKDALAQIIQAGQGEPGGPTPQTFNGELQGTIATDGGSFNGSNLYGHSSWDQNAHPASNFSIGSLVNPACGGENGSDDIGTIVINPNLPANLAATTFDLTIEIIDSSAGMGAMFLFCEDTLAIFGSQTAANGAPGAYTTTWDISGAPCSPDKIRVGITAFGATSSYPESNCDEINPSVETIVIVTPSECLPAIACFEQLFGCSFASMVSATSTTDDKLNAITQPRLVWSLDNAVPGFKWERWGPREGRDGDDKATFDARWGGPVVNGIPTHTDGAPTASGVETDTRFSQSERGQDEHRLTYCIDNRASTTDLEITDTDTRAESLRVYVGCECHSELTYERYQDDGSPYSSGGNVVATIPAGEIRIMTVLIHDPGPDFSGFRPVPVDGQIISYQDKPSVSCRIVEQPLCDSVGYELQSNESFKPIELTCKQCGGATDCQAEGCWRMKGFDYERGTNGFWDSGSFGATVNGVATSTPWNFSGNPNKSLGYQAMLDQVNATPGWSVTVITDAAMNSNDLVEFEFKFAGSCDDAVLNIVRTTGTRDQISFDANTGVGTFLDDSGDEISNDRQPVPC